MAITFDRKGRGLMTEQAQPTLVRLSDTELAPEPNEDVRGRTVVDSNGDEVGDVDDLLIDEQEEKVRLLEVGSGGFLGIGEKKRLIPVDAVTGIDEQVHIDLSRQAVAGSPEYDPQLVHESEYYRSLYGHYGYTPYWGPGYPPPRFPYF
jgi:sporulation protein YlmC with PRC-barrel domain